jgi:hypothetical protein
MSAIDTNEKYMSESSPRDNRKRRWKIVGPMPHGRAHKRNADAQLSLALMRLICTYGNGYRGGAVVSSKCHLR